MRINSLRWCRAVWGIALFAVALVLSVNQAQATTVNGFELDTEYKLSGSFHWGILGAMTLGADSRLIYDSTDNELRLTGTFKNSRGDFEFDWTLGQVRDNGHKTEFKFPNGAFHAHGMENIGTITPLFNLSIFNNRHHPLGNAAAGTDINVFAHGGPASIWLEGGHLIFQNWVKLWGAPLNFDIAGDPRFKLTKHTPPNEVPEPMSMALLATGLAGVAAKRRKQNA